MMITMVVRRRMVVRHRMAGLVPVMEGRMVAVTDLLLAKHRSTALVAPFLITTGIKANGCRKNTVIAIT
ncbi:hypothetical protein LMG28140_02239 [Paraburkholderia metrosideri]|uniref:Uncharacterized protein n=1 Tax=Paraburkholderia metrosideri TaxID=580937 RepID=A0ABM8NJU6_9BURK|nr:hypothetical protein LMG28140_02239 [Paraburkholderia metrosideri]